MKKKKSGFGHFRSKYDDSKRSAHGLQWVHSAWASPIIFFVFFLKELGQASGFKTLPSGSKNDPNHFSPTITAPLQPTHVWWPPQPRQHRTPQWSAANDHEGATLNDNHDSLCHPALHGRKPPLLQQRFIVPPHMVEQHRFAPNSIVERRRFAAPPSHCNNYGSTYEAHALRTALLCTCANV